MRYIYYIVIILIGITIAAGWGIFSDATVKISKPAIVINDRIITEPEFDNLIKSKPSYGNDEEFIDSLIVKELLIQEAIKRNINKDESFRASVEDFYEQSLIKILMDDQFKQYDPIVTDKEIEKYKTLSLRKIFISKLIYASQKDVGENKSKNVKTIESDFIDLASSLKFTVFNLKPGESSKGVTTIEGFIVYNLIKTEEIKDPEAVEKLNNEKLNNDQLNSEQLNNDRIAEFIKNGKKEMMLAEWVDELKEKAEIWRSK